MQPIPRLEIVKRICDLTRSEFLVVEQSPGVISANGETGSSWFLGSIKIRFEALMRLNEASHTVVYWELLKERSFVIGPIFSSKKFSFKGLSMKEEGSGTLSSGEQYSYDFGTFREMVRDIVEKGGWYFKKSLTKP